MLNLEISGGLSGPFGEEGGAKQRGCVSVHSEDVVDRASTDGLWGRGRAGEGSKGAVERVSTDDPNELA